MKWTPDLRSSLASHFNMNGLPRDGEALWPDRYAIPWTAVEISVVQPTAEPLPGPCADSGERDMGDVSRAVLHTLVFLV